MVDPNNRKVPSLSIPFSYHGGTRNTNNNSNPTTKGKVETIELELKPPPRTNRPSASSARSSGGVAVGVGLGDLGEFGGWKELDLMRKRVRKKDDLFWCIRHFLRFGKLWGIVPLDGVWNGECHKLRLRYGSISAIYSYLVLLLLSVNMVVGFLGLIRRGGSNTAEWAWSSESFIFYGMGCFIHIHFLRKGDKLISLIKSWPSLSSLYYSKEDLTLWRDTNFMAVLIFTSGILENALLQFIFFDTQQISGICRDPKVKVINQSLEDVDPLVKYFKKAQTHWADLLPYHDFWPILIFFSNKFALYAWNFVDILIILCSRAVSYKFKALNEMGREVLLDKPGGRDGVLWEKFVGEYKTLINVLKGFGKFLSPLIMSSYAINCFYTCLQLYLGLNEQETGASICNRIYAVWSFAHLLVRMFLVSFWGARVNDHATKTMDILYSAPEQCETKEMEKMRHRIATSRPGLGGLGCFVITRPFILKVINVIFTMEIVLLQAPAGSGTNGSWAEAISPLVNGAGQDETLKQLSLSSSSSTAFLGN